MQLQNQRHHQEGHRDGSETRILGESWENLGGILGESLRWRNGTRPTKKRTSDWIKAPTDNSINTNGRQPNNWQSRNNKRAMAGRAGPTPATFAHPVATGLPTGPQIGSKSGPNRVQSGLERVGPVALDVQHNSLRWTSERVCWKARQLFNAPSTDFFFLYSTASLFLSFSLPSFLSFLPFLPFLPSFPSFLAFLAFLPSFLLGGRRDERRLEGPGWSQLIIIGPAKNNISITSIESFDSTLSIHIIPMRDSNYIKSATGKSSADEIDRHNWPCHVMCQHHFLFRFIRFLALENK